MSITVDELDAIGVRPWSAYAHAFAGADLLLGNGFSIRLWRQFAYASLFDEFLKCCSPADAAVFSAFGTSNFEEIQRELLIGQKVAQILGTTLSQVTPLLLQLQEGLIRVVHQVHPKVASLPPGTFEELSAVLDQFSDIFTTSYDIFLYHVVMASNDRHRANSTVRPYQDFFWSHYDPTFLEFMNFQRLTHFKNVAYLHGALFLFSGWPLGHPNTLKLRRATMTDLLDTIDAQVRLGRFPLFVSEGVSQRKLAMIRTNAYLSFALQMLQCANERMVLFGTSLTPDYDQHIIDALNFKKRRIAISIHIGNKDVLQLKAEIHTYLSRLPAHDVWFFDADSLF